MNKARQNVPCRLQSRIYLQPYRRSTITWTKKCMTNTLCLKNKKIMTQLSRHNVYFVRWNKHGNYGYFLLRHIQSSEHVNSDLPIHSQIVRPVSTFVSHPAAGPAVHQYRDTTDFSRRDFRFTAASVWNWWATLSVFKSRHQTVFHRFTQAFTEH